MIDFPTNKFLRRTLRMSTCAACRRLPRHSSTFALEEEQGWTAFTDPTRASSKKLSAQTALIMGSSSSEGNMFWLGDHIEGCCICFV
jgi:hypothetical protein